MRTGKVEIKTYVVLNRSGRIVGVRLNKVSALALMVFKGGGTVEPHIAHKRLPNETPCKDQD